MNKEDYVSLECARLLREKGYDDECELAYETEKEPAKLVVHCMPNHRLSNTDYACPTLYEVQKWLREKHNLFIEITYMHGNYYIYSILTIPTHDYIGLACVRINSDNYEQCLNAGILEALKLI